MIMTCEFNSGRDVLMQLVKAFNESTIHELDVQMANAKSKYQIEWIKEYHHEMAPELIWFLVKHQYLPGFTFVPDHTFDSARSEDVGLDRFDMDARRALLGELRSTE